MTEWILAGTVLVMSVWIIILMWKVRWLKEDVALEKKWQGIYQTRYEQICRRLYGD